MDRFIIKYIGDVKPTMFLCHISVFQILVSKRVSQRAGLCYAAVVQAFKFAGVVAKRLLLLSFGFSAALAWLSMKMQKAGLDVPCWQMYSQDGART